MRTAMFEQFKKEGILTVNKASAKIEHPKYQRERMSVKDTALVMCSICNGFYSRSYIKRHSNRCQEKSEGCPPSAPVPVTLLQCDEDYAGEFVKDILNKFRQDRVGKVCTTDSVLLKLGRRLWYKQKRKADKKTEVRRSVMTDMRRLASLYLHMVDKEQTLGALPIKEGNLSDLYRRNNFRHLEEALDVYTSLENSESSQIKAGLKLGLYYLIKSSSKILKALYLIEDNDKQAADVDKFVSVLELNHNYISVHWK